MAEAIQMYFRNAWWFLFSQLDKYLDIVDRQCKVTWVNITDAILKVSFWLITHFEAAISIIIGLIKYICKQDH